MGAPRSFARGRDTTGSRRSRRRTGRCRHDRLEPRHRRDRRKASRSRSSSRVSRRVNPSGMSDASDRRISSISPRRKVVSAPEPSRRRTVCLSCRTSTPWSADQAFGGRGDRVGLETLGEGRAREDYRLQDRSCPEAPHGADGGEVGAHAAPVDPPRVALRARGLRSEQDLRGPSLVRRRREVARNPAILAWWRSSWSRETRSIASRPGAASERRNPSPASLAEAVDRRRPTRPELPVEVVRPPACRRASPSRAANGAADQVRRDKASACTDVEQPRWRALRPASPWPGTPRAQPGQRYRPAPSWPIRKSNAAGDGSQPAAGSARRASSRTSGGSAAESAKRARTGSNRLARSAARGLHRLQAYVRPGIRVVPATVLPPTSREAPPSWHRAMSHRTHTRRSLGDLRSRASSANSACMEG